MKRMSRLLWRIDIFKIFKTHKTANDCFRMAPKETKKPKQKKRSGDGEMQYLRKRRSREAANQKEKQIIKKKKDQLRYLRRKEAGTKLEAGVMLTSKERKLKKKLEEELQS